MKIIKIFALIAAAAMALAGCTGGYGEAEGVKSNGSAEAAIISGADKPAEESEPVVTAEPAATEPAVTSAAADAVHHEEEPHDGFDCGVEGFTIEGEHTHEADHHEEEPHSDFDCGVEGCTIEGEHTHEADHHEEEHHSDFDCGVEGCTIEGEHTHEADHHKEEHHGDHHD